MNWSRNYDLFILFGDTTGNTAPWQQQIWKTQIAPALDAILKASVHYKKTGVGTLQYVPKPNSSYFEPYKAGKLTWNDSGHDKWTFQAQTGSRRFHHLDIWTPSRGVCAKLEAAPDIFFSICNERDAYHKNPVAFEWMAVLAIEEGVAIAAPTQATELAHAMNAKRLIWRKQGWQQRVKDEHWHLPGSIQDIMSVNSYGQDVNLHDLDFAAIPFEPFWKVLL